MTELERIAAEMVKAKLSSFERLDVKDIIWGYCGEYVAGGVGDDGLVETIGVDIVRAVVTAMREPDAGSVRLLVGALSEFNIDRDDPYAAARNYWQTMIDALLAEKPE